MNERLEHFVPEQIAASGWDTASSSPDPPLGASAQPETMLASTSGYSANQRRNPSHLWLVLVVLLLLLAGPVLMGRFIYHATYNELKAGYDVATGALSELKPRLNDLELASRLVAKRVEPSVVSIIRPDIRGFEGQGSGVIVDKAGYIITNYHVVEGAEQVQVRLSDRRIADATVIGDDPMSDIAVLKIDLPNLIAAEWGDSDKLEVGDLVWALGSPFGLEHTLTFGIVSAKSRRSASRHLLTSSAYQEYLQTDAAVNPGNSGGPLVNIDGQVIGINAAIFGTAYQGISFAIPSMIAREQYEQLRANGRIERGWLGIQPADVPELVRERLALKLGEGVYVERVEPRTPAARSGLRVGDVILKWNDHMANDPTLLSRAIAATEIGSTAKLVYVRGNDSRDSQQLAVDVKVERRPPL
jgi:S1-C subfamily serine protease